MSKISKVRVKGSDGLFNQEINIGTSGDYVGMQSGLTLEEEFKLGENCITSFSSSDSSSSTILEEFRLEDQTTDFYKVLTTFEESEDGMTISQELLYVDEDANESSIKTKTIVFQSSDSGDLTIKEVID